MKIKENNMCTSCYSKKITKLKWLEPVCAKYCYDWIQVAILRDIFDWSVLPVHFFHPGGKIIFLWYVAYLSLSDQHAGCHVNTEADATGILTIDLSGVVITVLNCLITCLCHVIFSINSSRWICRHEITMRNYLFISPLYSHYRFSLSFWSSPPQ